MANMKKADNKARMRAYKASVFKQTFQSIHNVSVFYIPRNLSVGDIVVHTMLAAEVSKNLGTRRVYQIDKLDTEAIQYGDTLITDIVEGASIRVYKSNLILATPTEIVAYKTNGKNS